MEVDHIVEVGPFTNWNEFVPRVFCGQENLQALCTTCHMKKTQLYNSAPFRWKRKTA